MNTLVPLLFAALAADAQQPIVDFGQQVHPILLARCGSCHSGAQAQAGLSLTTRAAILKGGVTGPSIVPGKSAESLLIARITGTKPPRMPMGAAPLTEEEIGILRGWIDQGASAGETPAASKWVAPLAPRRPPVPAAGHPVDAFLRGSPGKVISDAQFARRVYFDLWGVPPSPEDLEEFEKDSRAGKREALVDDLLSNRLRYASHWITFWNDLLRNDEGVIYHGERKAITEWLYQALVNDLSYDRFVQRLLNPSRRNDPEGFLIGVNWRGEVNASELPPMQAAQNSAQVFLGINLKCNSCHDSFISNWKLKDAYGLASFFSDEELELVRCDVPQGETAKTKFLFAELGSVPEYLSLAKRRALAARLFTKRENGRFARTLVNRMWKQLFGRGLVEPVDDMSQPPWNPDLLDWLASYFADHGYNIKVLLRMLMTSRAYQLASVPERVEPYTFRGPERRRLAAEQFADAVSAITGEWRVLQSQPPEPGRYSREWQLKSTALTRALGRPMRDQVTTERLSQPTTLQALELVNGGTLAEMLRRGALRLVGDAKPPPVSLFDSGTVTRQRPLVDIDITGLKELWLLAEDVGSYDPARTLTAWAPAILIGPGGSTLAEQVAGRPLAKMPVPSEVRLDIAGKGFTRLRATASMDETSRADDIGGRARFFVFGEEPDRARLVRVGGYPPAPAFETKATADDLARRLYRHAFGRTPAEAERHAAVAMITSGGRLSAEGVEDLLWALFMSPEFQYLW